MKVCDDGETSAKRCKEEVITPLVELPQATVVHQLLQQGHSEVNINGIVAQNGTTTLQVIYYYCLVGTINDLLSMFIFRPVVVQPPVKKYRKQFY